MIKKMDLAYLTGNGTYINPWMSLAFGNKKITEVDNNPETLHEKWQEAGEAIRGFDKNEFLLVEPTVKRLGNQVAKKAFNYAVLERNFDKVEIGDKIVDKTTEINEEEIRLSHAVNFPYNGEQRILCVGPHYEEEATLFPASLHKAQGDKIFNLVVTEIPKDAGRPHLERLTREIYERDYGFSGEGIDYSFMNLPDRYVYSHEKKFKRELEKVIGDFKPTTIITTTPGANMDHQAVAEYLWEMTEGTDINYIFGNVLQNTKFNPNLFPIVDSEPRDKLVETFRDYSEGGIGMGADHKYSIDKLFDGIGYFEPMNRRTAFLKGEGEMSVNDRTGIYALEAVKLINPKGYRVPHSTKFFEKY